MYWFWWTTLFYLNSLIRTLCSDKMPITFRFSLVALFTKSDLSVDIYFCFEFWYSLFFLFYSVSMLSNVEYICDHNWFLWWWYYLNRMALGNVHLINCHNLLHWFPSSFKFPLQCGWNWSHLVGSFFFSYRFFTNNTQHSLSIICDPLQSHKSSGLFSNPSISVILVFMDFLLKFPEIFRFKLDFLFLSEKEWMSSFLVIYYCN